MEGAAKSEREIEREKVTVRGEDLTFSANWTATASRQTDRQTAFLSGRDR